MTNQSVDFYLVNDKIYLIAKELDYNNKHYVFLVNEMDASDFMIRIAGVNELLPVATDEDFNNVVKKMFC